VFASADTRTSTDAGLARVEAAHLLFATSAHRVLAAFVLAPGSKQ